MTSVIKLNRHDQFDENEGEIKVYFRIMCGNAGTYMEPPDPDEFEILKIEDAQKQDITDNFSDKEFKYIENYCLENVDLCYWESKADYLYNQRKENV